MKSVKRICYALVFGIVTVSCSSDTELSEEELKAANEAMKFNTVHNPYQLNNIPTHTWNNGMPRLHKVQFGKDLPSINQKTVGESEPITLGRE